MQRMEREGILLTSKEVIDGLFREKKAERIGFSDSPWPETLSGWIQDGYPTDEASGNPVNPAAYFQFDIVPVGGWFNWEPRMNEAETVEETDEWYIRRNGAGASLKFWKHKLGVPEYVDFRMTDREIWERDYRPYLLEPDEARVNIEGAKANLCAARKLGKWAMYEHLGLWEIMRSSLGDVCMLETLLMDPDWVLDFNRVYTDCFKAHHKILFEKAGLPDGVRLMDDLAYNGGTFCSPELLEKLYYPFYKEIADFFHSYGLPVIFHCCGNMEKALPMIVKAGYDGLHPMQRKAGCDPLKFARQYKDKLVFIGGLDSCVLERGDREEILRESKQLIDGMKEIGAAYVFGSDHSVSPLVKFSSFKTSVDCLKENWAYE